MLAVYVVVVRQPVNGCGLKRFGPKTVQVADGHENLERLVLNGLAAQGEQRFEHVVGVLPAGGGLGQLAVVLSVWVGNKKVSPDFDAAGNHQAAARIRAQARGEQHHVGVRPEDRACRSRAGDPAAHCHVEALHAGGIGEVLLHRTVDASQRVEQTGHPAIILGNQLVEEARA